MTGASGFMLTRMATTCIVSRQAVRSRNSRTLDRLLYGAWSQTKTRVCGSCQAPGYWDTPKMDILSPLEIGGSRRSIHTPCCAALTARCICGLMEISCFCKVLRQELSIIFRLVCVAIWIHGASMRKVSFGLEVVA